MNRASSVALAGLDLDILATNGFISLTSSGPRQEMRNGRRERDLAASQQPVNQAHRISDLLVPCASEESRLDTGIPVATSHPGW
jgi:hypothetical protein